MRKGNFIKHEKYMDICLELVNVFDYGHGYAIKAKVWNMGFINSFPVGQNWRLNIAKNEKDIKSGAGRNTQIGEWQILSGTALMDQCYRNSNWLEIKEII